MSEPEVIAAFLALAGVLYPDRRPAPPPPEFVMLAAPERCETCGTSVFPARWGSGDVRLWHIGWEHARHKARLVQHRPALCSSARRAGIRLDGRRLVPAGSDHA